MALPDNAAVPEQEHFEWEPDVLPVFYYNDLLVSRLGEQLGLNLFEPRYQEMCRRMASDPRFIFMPNYEDYSCRKGDVGFIIRVTQLNQHRSSSTYGIRGYAEELVAVACTWVEHNTNGLHHAHVWKLDGRERALSFEELRSLYRILGQRGWRRVDCPDSRQLFEGDRGQLMLGCNWPDRVYVLAPSVGNADMSPLFAEAGLASGPQKVPGPPRKLPLSDICEDLMRMLRQDPMSGIAGRPNQQLWQRLLRDVRLCTIGEMVAPLATVRLVILDAEVDSGAHHQLRRCVQETFPRSQVFDDHGSCVVGDNGTNVLFYAHSAHVGVTMDSALAALASLSWQLNCFRLQLVRWARDAGKGQLAKLNDNALELVCEFISPRAAR